MDIKRRIIGIIGIILSAALIFSGCGSVPAVEGETSGTIAAGDGASETAGNVSAEADTEAETKEPYRFIPHLHSTYLGGAIPEDHYEALYNLIDALREGRDTFECSSREAYDWATDAATLNNLFPAACVKVSGESTDGTAPFENGIGRVYLNMPSEEFVKREAQFEADIEEVLNTYLEPDDNDFEKCLKLFDYMASTFTYGDVDTESAGDGADYKAFQQKTGVCDHIAGIYAYLLMQAGVEAYNIGIFEPDMCHAWTYVIVNGKGYHVDATWSLKYSGQKELYLDYFMMSDERREATGCKLSDITAPLLPGFWASKYDAIDFKASDKSYEFPESGIFKELDEENKILYYYDMGDELHQMSYCN